MSKSGYLLGGIELLTQCAENQRTNIYWTVVYVRKGIGIYLLDSDLRPLNEGELFILPPKVSYSFSAKELGDEYNESVDAVILRFDNIWLTELLGIFKTMSSEILGIRELVEPSSIYGPKWIKSVAILDELASASASRQAVLVIKMLELLSTKQDLITIHQPSPADALTLEERRQKIDRYISSHLIEKVSLEHVAAYLGMNRTYFCMFFKRHYGVGFADYLNDLRIEKATSMLMGGRQIADIAKECGFKTAPYFTRAFRRSRGMTPLEYRKKYSDK